MGIRPAALVRPLRLRLPRQRRRPSCPRRWLLTLAIETSCDDTSVAILEKGTQDDAPAARLHFHKKVTSNNVEFQGVHPLVSLQSHQENLAKLVDEATQHLPANGDTKTRLPDLISVTRGPGMRSNLFTGLDTAKGLAVAWQKPLVGVHHMQGHALTPRLVDALRTYQDGELHDASSKRPSEPQFPFLSVLASGGHTLLIHSASLTDHQVMATTNDIAIGECLDKIARVVLPAEILQTAKSTMYGALLEDFAFPNTSKSTPEPNKLNSNVRTASEYRNIHKNDYIHEVPKNHGEVIKQNMTKWGWGFSQPLTKAAGGLKSKSMEMSFSGLTTAAERAVRYQTNLSTGKPTKIERLVEDVSITERVDMAKEAMRASFEHIASRVVLGLQQIAPSYSDKMPSLVLAGGVAANSFFRYLLASTLCAHGYPDIILHFPPPQFCTDNAAMIAWTGIEMFEAGYTDSLSIRAVRKWPLDHLLSPPKDM